jgi:hypothetical protein
MNDTGIVFRDGFSAGNIKNTLWYTKADNLPTSDYKYISYTCLYAATGCMLKFISTHDFY